MIWFSCSSSIVRCSCEILWYWRKCIARADVIKRIWQYIKENDLQDPADKKTSICDERLKELFQVDSFHGFTVTKLLSLDCSFYQKRRLILWLACNWQ
ncbi:hypothetical protein K7X08_008837 [Anisodus acutangulus]|uniref:DM2 domain-containing protein n=1 Tax=Anisodus acutangulus TaxID=402998 RepID=A0A9Q1N2J3_9SOLA|nr:hypothetical protein K7X08_008837 [Anisodus acutangulus]